MKVSIVVPTHRRREMLLRLLESLRLLTYPKSQLELIVVGGASDPGRMSVEAFGVSSGFPVSYLVVPDDKSGAVGLKRNLGAHAARGDILAFVDDDCVVHAEWLSEAVPLFECPEVGGVEGTIDVPKPDQPTATYRGSLRLSSPGGYRTGNMLYRKSAFDSCGGFDESLSYFEDTDLGYTVIERGYRIPFAQTAVVNHPVQPGRPLKLLTLARAVQHVPYLLGKHSQSKPKLGHLFRPFNRSHYLYLALYAISVGLMLVHPVTGAVSLGVGLLILVTLHLTHDLWGVHFTTGELLLTGLCHPIVPVLRLIYWLKGMGAARLQERGVVSLSALK